MIDVSFLIEDPHFAFPYTILRRTGHWEGGRFIVNEPLRLSYYGAVQPAVERELEQMDIGDNAVGIMKFFAKQPRDIYVTQDWNTAPNDAQISDEIEFRGLLYKVLKVKPWQHNLWVRAFGVMKGEANNGS